MTVGPAISCLTQGLTIEPSHVLKWCALINKTELIVSARRVVRTVDFTGSGSVYAHLVSWAETKSPTCALMGADMRTETIIVLRAGLFQLSAVHLCDLVIACFGCPSASPHTPHSPLFIHPTVTLAFGVFCSRDPSVFCLDSTPFLTLTLRYSHDIDTMSIDTNPMDAGVESLAHKIVDAYTA